MHPRDKLGIIIFLGCLVVPSESLLFPILFPVSIKITIHSRTKPTPPPKHSYHFESVPVYREVSVKSHLSSTPKYSYADGAKYGSNYGDGTYKVYTEEPHIQGPNYGNGYNSGGSIQGHISITATPTSHYKGSPYEGVQFPKTRYKGSSGGTHYKGTTYEEVPQTHYKGTTYEEVPQTHYKGTTYEEVPQTHYKGTTYEKVPQTHYKGTTYEEIPQTHYKGTTYEKEPQTHYKGSTDGTHYKGSSVGTHYKDSGGDAYYKDSSYDGTAQTHHQGISYEDALSGYKSPSYTTNSKNVHKQHSYIKSVGGYKLTDYIDENKATKYPEEYLVIKPGKTYGDIEAAHKATHRPKAYAAEEYSDIGAPKYNKDYEHDASYIDDSLPAYKASIPRPGTRYVHQESASRYDRVVPASSKESKVYAGFGTSIYGDSYAKVIYVPKTFRIRFSAVSHK